MGFLKTLIHGVNSVTRNKRLEEIGTEIGDNLKSQLCKLKLKFELNEIKWFLHVHKKNKNTHKN
jgi:hypothetical protein